MNKTEQFLRKMLDGGKITDPEIGDVTAYITAHRPDPLTETYFAKFTFNRILSSLDYHYNTELEVWEKQ